MSGGTPPSEVVIVTGMSGAGRSTAANALEDLGWFVVDNLPPAMLQSLTDLGRSRGAVTRFAAVVDVRSRDFFVDLTAAVDALAAQGIRPRILFLEASDGALVRRFESSRRPHPLQGGGRIVDGIARERQMLLDVRADADAVIDTSDLNVHQLSAAVARHFGDGEAAALRVTVMSFGFKYGLPVDADSVADVRFLPNPHWVPDLRPQTGLQTDVRDYVLGQPGAEDFLDRYAAATAVVLDGYRREGKRYATLAIGCTGGKHRSVVMAEELAARLTKDADDGVTLTVLHRDLGQE